MQANGVHQGNPLSHLTFNIATNDVMQAFQSENRRTKTYAHVDDIVLVSVAIQELQEISMTWFNAQKTTAYKYTQEE
jgi:hypothetical protein